MCPQRRLRRSELLEDRLEIPIEVLNANNQAGIPPNRLLLKPGTPVMVLRNLNPSRSIMNGTVLIYEEIINNCLMRVKNRV